MVVLGGRGAAESESMNVTLKCSAVPLMHDRHFTHSKSDFVPQGVLLILQEDVQIYIQSINKLETNDDKLHIV